MSTRGEVLVAIINNLLDFSIARDKHWYRIPVSSVDKWLKDRWPPDWLAFYQTKVFGREQHAVNYYARVLDIRKVYRWQLFSIDSRDEKRNRRYYQLILEPLQRLNRPIISPRWRRIVFIPTTWPKFVTADEVNDLYDDSPLEDRFWAEFKRLEIKAERQVFVEVKKQHYALDFAIFCASGKLDVETDGDLWHANPDRSADDNVRDNHLKTVGWQVLRVSSRQIREKMEAYCLPTVVENIDRLGGVDEGCIVPRHVDLNTLDGLHQLGLFDEG